ncbi:unnamed protein product, partial [Mesorhabditis spiculigera]
MDFLPFPHAEQLPDPFELGFKRQPNFWCPNLVWVALLLAIPGALGFFAAWAVEVDHTKPTKLVGCGELTIECEDDEIPCQPLESQAGFPSELRCTYRTFLFMINDSYVNADPVTGSMYAMSDTDEWPYTKNIWLEMTTPERTYAYQLSNFTSQVLQMSPVFDTSWMALTIANRNVDETWNSPMGALIHLQADLPEAEIYLFRAIRQTSIQCTRVDADKLLMLTILIPSGNIVMSNFDLDGDWKISIMEQGSGAFDVRSLYVWTDANITEIKDEKVNVKSSAVTIYGLDASSISFFIEET